MNPVFGPAIGLFYYINDKAYVRDIPCFFIRYAKIRDALRDTPAKQ